jgi:hypothetical protein
VIGNAVYVMADRSGCYRGCSAAEGPCAKLARVPQARQDRAGAEYQEASMTPEQKAEFVKLFSGPRRPGRDRFGGRVYDLLRLDETEGCDMQQAIAIMIGVALIAGVSQSARAQCPAGAQIFIAPRLVPQRPQIDRDALQRLLASPTMDAAIKQQMYQQYMTQYQPVEVPFHGGKVLINPRDPCIQQYIGR